MLGGFMLSFYFIYQPCALYCILRLIISVSTSVQGRNEVRWYQGQETSLGPSYSNLRLFESKCAVEEITCDIAVTFRRPLQSFGAPIVIRRPGNCAPPCHPVTPVHL